MNARRVSLILVGVWLTLATACAMAPGSSINNPESVPPTATLLPVALPVILAESSGEHDDASVSTTTADLPTTERPTQTPESLVQAQATATDALPTPPSTATPVPSPTPCAKPGQLMAGQFESQYAGPMNYRIYFPPCYTAGGRSYPVLYMLPGNIHTESIWDDLGLDEEAEQGIRDERYAPLLLVMVAGGQLANYTSGGPASYESFMMEEFIPYIEDTYCAWSTAEGRAIGGLSRGGYWALEIAFQYPESFVSVGGHSAALLDHNGGPTLDPSETGLNNDLGDLRVYLDAGEDDWLLYGVQQLHEGLVDAGREHTWLLNEGQHEDAYWAAHVGDYLAWYTQPWLEDARNYPPCRAVGRGNTS